jgi:tRNA threonylcarbamoyladenosine biosynthesis protein TsaB
MALILHIETATQVCSTALSRDGEIIEIRETSDPRSHASRLGPFIEELMSSSGNDFSSLDAIALSLGPGSYTGLRIGASTAKGIAYATGKPAIGISTLKSLANRFIAEHKDLISGTEGEALYLCPMIDARRLEVYASIYTPDLKAVRETKADILNSKSFIEYLEKGKVFFFGNGSDKFRDMIHHNNAEFTEGVEPSARYMARLAETSFCMGDFLDLAYFEPFYLKDFIATIPKNKIIPPQKQA